MIFFWGERAGDGIDGLGEDCSWMRGGVGGGVWKRAVVLPVVEESSPAGDGGSMNPNTVALP